LPAGKSCFLEGVGFGLGASAAELRVNNLSELCGKNCTGQRVKVVLKFIKGSLSLTVGSSIVDGTRLYFIDNSKVTKIKFSQSLTDTLGFSKDSISWNISQRAVQEIVSKFLKIQIIFYCIQYIYIYIYQPSWQRF
jgi:chromosome segregation ATPase